MARHVIAWLTDLLRRIGSRVGFGRAQTDSDEFDPELREVFFAELADVQQTLDSAFALWRVNVADEAALKNLRRGFHTIKGSAQLVGATALGDFCRHMEQLAIRLMEQKIKVTPAMIGTVEQAISVLPMFARTIREGRPAPVQAQAISNRAQRLLG
ncbi:MAG: Hpt domain-containing protein [Rhodanobacteraceae bacterium]|nr:Hpt domain-containing protein [Rhodanobacteraceae bacterium]